MVPHKIWLHHWFTGCVQALCLCNMETTAAYVKKILTNAH